MISSQDHIGDVMAIAEYFDAAISTLRQCFPKLSGDSAQYISTEHRIS